MRNAQEGLKAYLRAPFTLVVWVMETYARNRALVKTFMSKPRMSAIFTGAIALTALAWIAIGLNAQDEDRGRMTDAVKALWSDTQALSEEKQRLDAIRQAESAQ